MFVIIKKLIKIVYYKLFKITIDVPGFAKFIINIVIKHYNF